MSLILSVYLVGVAFWALVVWTFGRKSVWLSFLSATFWPFVSGFFLLVAVLMFWQYARYVASIEAIKLIAKTKRK